MIESIRSRINGATSYIIISCINLNKFSEFTTCLLLFYCGLYNWDTCMGTTPYLKKASTQIYFVALVYLISSATE